MVISRVKSTHYSESADDDEMILRKDDNQMKKHLGENLKLVSNWWTSKLNKGFLCPRRTVIHSKLITQTLLAIEIININLLLLSIW